FRRVLFRSLLSIRLIRSEIRLTGQKNLSSPSLEFAVTETRSELVLDTSDLGRGPGHMRKLQKTVPAPADLKVPLIGVPEGSSLELDIRLETLEDGVLATVDVSGETKGECGRCLDAFTQPLDVTIQELYLHPEAAAQVDDEDETADVVYKLEDEL